MTCQLGDDAQSLPSLRGDCSHCVGLCCLALAFDASLAFGLDKPAGRACPHLTSGHECAIHRERGARGFAGCERYDCLGAGQHATSLFEDRNWSHNPELARRMCEVFSLLHDVHELLSLLRASERLPIAIGLRAQRSALYQRLLPSGGWTESSLTRLPIASLRRDVMRWLSGLQRCVPREALLELRRSAPLVPSAPQPPMNDISTFEALSVCDARSSE